jgi:hypothetical protein
MLRTIRRSWAVILVLVSIFLFVWAAIPNQHQTYVQDISLPDIKPPNGDGSTALLSMNSRWVTLEWPNSMRIGEMEEITLSFKPVAGNNLAADAQMVENSVYERYNLMAEGRFEVAGVRVKPSNPIRESMPEGQVVKFTWQISSNKAGIYDGTVWLSLRLLPLDGSPAIQVPIFIKETTIQATSLFGLNIGMVYILGGVGVALAMITASSDIIGLKRKWQKQKSAQGNKVTN